MKQLMIIDESQQDQSFRGEKILNLSKSISDLETTFLTYIYGDKQEKNPPVWNDTMFQRIGFANVYLIHSSNVLAIDLINYINKKYPDSYLVEYSGGGNEYMKNRKSVGERHCIYPKVVGIDGIFLHLKEFIEALQKNQSEPLKILIGYNNKLNSALQFLHECLGGNPANLKILTEGEFTNEDLGNKNNEGSIRYLYKNMEGKKNGEYIKELRTLRDAILKRAGIE